MERARPGQITTEKQARQELQGFLMRNASAIRPLRTYCQAVDGARFKLSLEELQELDQAIESGSWGVLTKASGALCQVSDYSEIFQHHGVVMGNELGEGIQAIRGFYFHFGIGSQRFECVDLDGGLSRVYFDQKTQVEKRVFLSRFAGRRRDSLVYLGPREELSLGFCAAITDLGQGFRIEELVAYRDEEPPITSVRPRLPYPTSPLSWQRNSWVL